METEGTLLLNRSDVEQLLNLNECINAVEEVFRLQGDGKIQRSEILGVTTPSGGLHVKAGILLGHKNHIVAKLNSNFPNNRAQFGLPTIQGLIAIFDTNNGLPRALLDSIDITIKRTAAATAVAAKFLARKHSTVATICGCGLQGRAQIRALHLVLPLTKAYAFDLDDDAAKTFAIELSRELNIDIEPARDLPGAIGNSDVVVTCTPSRQFFVHKDDVPSGTLIAAVGADDSHKQEIDPALLASAKIVADNLEQVCAIGDTQHAIAAGLMRKEDIYADLSEIVAGRKPGRTSDEEIFIFDSTGVAIEDAAAAAIVCEKARARNVGHHFAFAA